MTNPDPRRRGLDFGERRETENDKYALVLGKVRDSIRKNVHPALRLVMKDKPDGTKVKLEAFIASGPTHLVGMYKTKPGDTVTKHGDAIQDVDRYKDLGKAGKGRIDGTRVTYYQESEFVVLGTLKEITQYFANPSVEALVLAKVPIDEYDVLDEHSDDEDPDPNLPHSFSVGVRLHPETEYGKEARPEYLGGIQSHAIGQAGKVASSVGGAVTGLTEAGASVINDVVQPVIEKAAEPLGGALRMLAKKAGLKVHRRRNRFDWDREMAEQFLRFEVVLHPNSDIAKTAFSAVKIWTDLPEHVLEVGKNKFKVTAVSMDAIGNHVTATLIPQVFDEIESKVAELNSDAEDEDGSIIVSDPTSSDSEKSGSDKSDSAESSSHEKSDSDESRSHEKSDSDESDAEDSSESRV